MSGSNLLSLNWRYLKKNQIGKSQFQLYINVIIIILRLETGERERERERERVSEIVYNSLYE